MEQTSRVAQLYQQQIKLEENAIDEAVRHYSRQMGNPTAKLPTEYAFLEKALPLFVEALEEYQAAGRGKKGRTWETFSDLPATDIAFLTINNTIQSLMSDRAQLPVQKLAATIGADLLDHSEYLRFVQQCKDNGSKAHKWVQENHKSATTWKRRAAITKVAQEEGITLRESRAQALLTVPDEQLTDIDEFRVGEKALDLLMTSTKMFEHAGGTSKNGNTCLYLAPTPATEEWLNDIHTLSAISRPRYLPCVIPPREWQDLVGGGYYLKKGKSRLKLLRTRGRKAFQANAGNDLSQVFKATNTLQNTQWRVNHRVLETMQQSVLLPGTDNVYVPLPMAESAMEAQFKKVTLPSSYTQNLRRRKEGFEKIVSLKSQGFAARKTLQIAEGMAEYESIYYPHSLDYRGREYAVPAYFHPQAGDIAKGLLEFSKGHTLGERGAYWLAIHGANCWGNGLDKDEFKNRFQWVLDHKSDIKDASERPLESSFWPNAESPWCFLAFCFEWAGYLEQGGAFESRLSIDKDGSCNGLQHLSAILKDEKGGALVNLIPTTRPSDVYTTVKEYVSDAVERSEEPLAKLWGGLVDRKIVKRPVMTQGYGVTRPGITKQLSKELSKREGSEWDPIKASGFQGCTILADIIDGSIEAAMPGVFKVKDWLREVAEKFTAKNLPITWTVPTGLTVVQQNFKTTTVKIKSFYGVAQLKGGVNPSRVSMAQDTAKLDKNEQMNGIVPNVIHSLDAAHLMMVVNECAAQGITDFHAIHDSFGVHACHVDTLDRIIREQFIKLYQGDILEDLRLQFEQQLGEPLDGIEWRGSLDISKVMEADYFFA